MSHPDSRWEAYGDHSLPTSPDDVWMSTGSQPIAAAGRPRQAAAGASMPAVDVLICFDTTGSMDDLIAPLVRQVATFVRESDARGLDLRWGLIAFGDLRVPGDKVVRYPFTDDRRKFVRALKGMPRFSGGGNRGETSLDALAAAARHPKWRPEAVHICVLLTDEVPRGVGVTLEECGRTLRERRVLLFCVSIRHRAYSWLAQVTGGEWWDIDQPVPFDEILARLARRVMTVATEVWPRLGSGES